MTSAIAATSEARVMRNGLNGATFVAGARASARARDMASCGVVAPGQLQLRRAAQWYRLHRYGYRTTPRGFWVCVVDYDLILQQNPRERYADRRERNHEPYPPRCSSVRLLFRRRFVRRLRSRAPRQSRPTRVSASRSIDPRCSWQKVERTAWSKPRARRKPTSCLMYPGS